MPSYILAPLILPLLAMAAAFLFVLIDHLFHFLDCIFRALSLIALLLHILDPVLSEAFGVSLLSSCLNLMTLNQN